MIRLVALGLRKFVQYLIAFCSRPETNNDVISGMFAGSIFPDTFVKFCDIHLNRSGEIKPKAIGCGILAVFFNLDNCRPEVAGDVVSGVALDHVGMDVTAKFADFS